MSRFGDLIRRLRKENGLSLGEAADEIGTVKAYISGIETNTLSPPSVKMIRKIAAFFRQDARDLVRLAWVDKAPALIRRDAEDFLTWYESRRPSPERAKGSKGSGVNGLRWVTGGRRPNRRGPGRPVLWSRAAILAKIQSLYRAGHPLGSRAVLRTPGLGGLWTAARREFGSWLQALREAGIPEKAIIARRYSSGTPTQRRRA